MAEKESFNWLLAIILSSACLILLVIVIMAFSTFGKNALIDENCDHSIREHLSLKHLSGGLQDNPITCPTKVIATSVDDSQEIKRILAEQMASCWSTWRQGQESFFVGEGVFCHVCSAVEFEHTDVQVPNFKKYLETTRMSATGETFASFLTNKELPTTYHVLKDTARTDPVLGTISTEQPVSIIFMQARGQEFTKKTLSKIATGTSWALAGGTVIASTVAGAKLGGLIGVYGGPIGAAAGVVIGSVSGAVAGSGLFNYFEENDIYAPPEEVDLTVLRPLDESILTNLGCTYLPVKQQ